MLIMMRCYHVSVLLGIMVMRLTATMFLTAVLLGVVFIVTMLMGMVFIIIMMLTIAPIRSFIRPVFWEGKNGNE